jgi:putative flavoprotein involved in K+ transport
MAFPAPGWTFPTKDETADYLERYAERFDLPVRSSTRAESLVRDGERWVLRTSRGTLQADNVVVATGPFQRPRVPDLSARLSPEIHQLHSSEYHSPFDLPDGPVLVVGAGNSGAQIALELASDRTVWLAGRDTGHMPRRLLGRDLFDWLWPVMHRFSLDTRLGRRMHRRAADGGDALIGIPERSLIEGGVVRVARVESVRDGWPVCGDRALQPRTVIWCTGFQSDYRWIDAPVFDERGVPRPSRGVGADSPGLYLLGLRLQHPLTSSRGGGVKHDAEFVASEVARRVEAAMAE